MHDATHTVGIHACAWAAEDMAACAADRDVTVAYALCSSTYASDAFVCSDQGHIRCSVSSVESVL